MDSCPFTPSKPASTNAPIPASATNAPAKTIMSDPTFLDIKAILNWLINGSNWDALHGYHGANFKWETREELLAAFVQLDPTECTPDEDCFRLIKPELIGTGRATETYLYIALSNATGVKNNGRMPYGKNADNSYATPFQLATIAKWIDNGCP